MHGRNPLDWLGRAEVDRTAQCARLGPPFSTIAHRNGRWAEDEDRLVLALEKWSDAPRRQYLQLIAWAFWRRGKN